MALYPSGFTILNRKPRCLTVKKQLAVAVVEPEIVLSLFEISLILRPVLKLLHLLTPSGPVTRRSRFLYLVCRSQLSKPSDLIESQM